MVEYCPQVSAAIAQSQFVSEVLSFWSQLTKDTLL